MPVLVSDLGYINNEAQSILEEEKRKLRDKGYTDAEIGFMVSWGMRWASGMTRTFVGADRPKDEIIAAIRRNIPMALRAGESFYGIRTSSPYLTSWEALVAERYGELCGIALLDGWTPPPLTRRLINWLGS